ncbi:MAG: hypothetical protein HY050_00510 [Actinobacteria bacterium]|nr:hypothetical protein [Actinomycetota bacterium]
MGSFRDEAFQILDYPRFGIATLEGKDHFRVVRDGIGMDLAFLINGQFVGAPMVSGNREDFSTVDGRVQQSVTRSQESTKGVVQGQSWFAKELDFGGFNFEVRGKEVDRRIEENSSPGGVL